MSRPNYGACDNSVVLLHLFDSFDSYFLSSAVLPYLPQTEASALATVNRQYRRQLNYGHNARSLRLLQHKIKMELIRKCLQWKSIIDWSLLLYNCSVCWMQPVALVVMIMINIHENRLNAHIIPSVLVFLPLICWCFISLALYLVLLSGQSPVCYSRPNLEKLSVMALTRFRQIEQQFCIFHFALLLTFVSLWCIAYIFFFTCALIPCILLLYYIIGYLVWISFYENTGQLLLLTETPAFILQ